MATLFVSIRLANKRLPYLAASHRVSLITSTHLSVTRELETLSTREGGAPVTETWPGPGLAWEIMLQVPITLAK